MKHYVLGFIFNKYRDKILLIEKNRPVWAAGHWNGIGGKVEHEIDGRLETPDEAMFRECAEETGIYRADFEHAITMLCDGGTFFVYRSFCIEDKIPFTQIEDEILKVWSVAHLPKNMMVSCKWMIEICLADHIKYPVIVQQMGYGAD